VLAREDTYEALFCILFAPSCPVIVDPTGEMEKFIREKFLSSFGVEQISGADITGNGLLENCLLSNKAAVLKDVSFYNDINGGLSLDQ
jgi:hypothetical protein